MSISRKLALMSALAVSALLTVPISSLAGNWEPIATNVDLSGTLFRLTVGTLTIQCYSTQATGMIPNANPRMVWTFTPAFNVCATGMGRITSAATGAWEAKSVSTTRVNIAIPAGGGAEFTVKTNPVCKINIVPQELGTNGDFRAGTNATRDPSLLLFVASTQLMGVMITQTQIDSANCENASTTATLAWGAILKNPTNVITAN